MATSLSRMARWRRQGGGGDLAGSAFASMIHRILGPMPMPRQPRLMARPRPMVMPVPMSPMLMPMLAVLAVLAVLAGWQLARRVSPRTQAREAPSWAKKQQVSRTPSVIIAVHPCHRSFGLGGDGSMDRQTVGIKNRHEKPNQTEPALFFSVYLFFFLAVEGSPT